jgi:hypothetical protein
MTQEHNMRETENSVFRVDRSEKSVIHIDMGRVTHGLYSNFLISFLLTEAYKKEPSES